MKTEREKLKELVYNWHAVKKYFKPKEDEDFPTYVESSRMTVKYIPRKINHPKFKNMSIMSAKDFLSDKNVGECVFRPSSKGTDFLNLTWKFHEGVLMHILIKEEGKTPNSLIGRKLTIGKDSYDSLDEIIDKYIVPCN
jgi:transcription elongation factor SPT6